MITTARFILALGIALLLAVYWLGHPQAAVEGRFHLMSSDIVTSDTSYRRYTVEVVRDKFTNKCYAVYTISGYSGPASLGEVTCGVVDDSKMRFGK